MVEGYAGSDDEKRVRTSAGFWACGQWDVADWKDGTMQLITD